MAALASDRVIVSNEGRAKVEFKLSMLFCPSSSPPIFDINGFATKIHSELCQKIYTGTWHKRHIINNSHGYFPTVTLLCDFLA